MITRQRVLRYTRGEPDGVILSSRVHVPESAMASQAWWWCREMVLEFIFLHVTRPIVRPIIDMLKNSPWNSV